MIQDSVNQLLAIAGAAGAYGKRQRIANAKADIDIGKAAAEQKISTSDPTDPTSNPIGIAGNEANRLQSKYNIEYGAKPDDKLGFMGKVKRAFTPKEITAYAESAKKDIYRSAINRGQSYNEEMANMARNNVVQQIEGASNQANAYKAFVEKIAGGYSRHGKGQQLYNFAEEAKKLLEGGNE